MNVKFYCPDIECDSCVKAIKNKIEKLDGINKLMLHKDSFDIYYNKESINEAEIKRIIKDLGYRISLEPFERGNFSARFKDFWKNKHRYEVEYTMIKYSLSTLFILIVLQALAYLVLFTQTINLNEEFLIRYAWWIFYADLAVVSIGAAMWHLKSYRGQVTSMVGMMLGMTFGMQTGLMIGTIIGATNGVFIGGLTGMLAGVIVGSYNGRCCGIMGVLEGMMAGMMNGIMGSMIGVMFFGRKEHVYLLLNTEIKAFSILC